MRKLRAWFESSDQELLRLELDWFGRWLLRGKGLALLLLVCLLAAIPFIFWLRWFISFGVWIFLFQRRVLARFGQGNMQELLVLPINGRMVWPAFLVAPLAWLVIDQIAVLQGSILQSTLILLANQSVGEFAGPLGLGVGFLMNLINFPIKIISAFALCVFVARFTVLNVSFARFIFVAFLSHIFLMMFGCLFPLIAFLGWVVLRDMRSDIGWNRMLAKASEVMAA